MERKGWLNRVNYSETVSYERETEGDTNRMRWEERWYGRMDDGGREGGVEAEGKRERWGESREIRTGNPGRSKSWAFKIWVNTPKPLFCPPVPCDVHVCVCVCVCVYWGEIWARRETSEALLSIHSITSVKTSCKLCLSLLTSRYGFKTIKSSVLPYSPRIVSVPVNLIHLFVFLSPQSRTSLTQACKRNAISCFGENNWPTSLIDLRKPGREGISLTWIKKMQWAFFTLTCSILTSLALYQLSFYDISIFMVNKQVQIKLTAFLNHYTAF